MQGIHLILKNSDIGEIRRGKYLRGSSFSESTDVIKMSQVVQRGKTRHFLHFILKAGFKTMMSGKQKSIEYSHITNFHIKKDIVVDVRLRARISH